MKNGGNGQKLEHAYEPLAVTWYRGSYLLLVREGNELFLATSTYGTHFSVNRRKIVLIRTLSASVERVAHCSNFRLSTSDKGYILTYLRHSRTQKHLICAISKNFADWRVISELKNINEPGFVISEYKHAGRYILLFGDLFLRQAESKDLKSWRIHKHLMMTPRNGHFDSMHVHTLTAEVVDTALFTLYESETYQNGKRLFSLGTAAFLTTNPLYLVERPRTAILSTFLTLDETLIFIGAVRKDKTAVVFFHSNRQGLLHFTIPFSLSGEIGPRNLKKFGGNPILEPRPEHEWESTATFNPAALHTNGAVHILYRAVGKSGFSFLGYAASKDGFTIDNRLPEPAYHPRESFEGVNTTPGHYRDLFISGGGWGGCEDPKLTVLEDTVHLTYVAYDGWREPRAALSSIPKTEFLDKNWAAWDRPQLMSRPGIIDKSACILPEKIDGKYVVFHRVFPNILIDFVDKLSFGPRRWLKNEFKIPPREHMWDSRKLSIGAPPIKVADGWLAIYHAVDDRDDSKYKMGAMLLHPKRPYEVLYRTNRPILVPDMPYENDGKPGVAYPCGAAVINGRLFVYYGGGDKVVCVATALLDEFLGELRHEEPVFMESRPVTVR